MTIVEKRKKDRDEWDEREIIKERRGDELHF